jgi:uncharacterized protein YbaA (DUF1428 family)
MASYVDGFVIPIPTKNLAAYRKMAAQGARIWREHGALDYRECVVDDAPQPEGMATGLFHKLAKAKRGETVIFAYIVYKSRAHRDRVNTKVMADPRLAAMCDPKGPMPFDMKRMTYGGFKTIVSR